MSKTAAFRRGLGVVFGVLLIALAVMPAVTAFAANTGDKNYSFYFSGYGATQGTNAERKDTSTPCYIHVKSKQPSYVNFYIDGSNTNSFSDMSLWHPCTTGGGVATAYNTGYYLIHNNVNELGFTYARLTAWSDGYSGSVSGEWSPDTNMTGVYPYLN